MITDNERREVAYRLRNMSKYTNPDNVYDSLSQATGVDDVIDGNGSLVAYLADLIEPSGHECVPGECPLNVRHDNDRIDRDALLALADEMTVERGDIWRWSSRIRKALGVDDA